jgi:glutaminase
MKKPAPARPARSRRTDATPMASDVVDERELNLFLSLDVDGDGSITREAFLDVLASLGLREDDHRLVECVRRLQQYGLRQPLDFAAFVEVVRPNILLIERALQGQLAIPDFRSFCRDIDSMFDLARERRDGDVARYIPQLSRVNPEQFGLALCTVDGQRYSLGESDVDFCVQSCCKPLNYAIALEEHGDAYVHQFVGREPSGRSFNELTLDHDGKPHNPMVNSGAIMCCALIDRDAAPADRFDYVLGRWKAAAGGMKAGFSNATYLSERQSGDRNFAIGYYMQEKRAFPEGTDLLATLEFYFQCCSIESTCDKMSVVAATLANGGVCPITGEQIFSTQTVEHTLSLMSSCGMYDFSGEFAFSVGLPAKSGVAGAIMVVVPNVMGFCTWSPRLDRLGNSVRGVDFCKQLVNRFNFHIFENISGLSDKKDPRISRIRAFSDDITAMIWAASKGDLTAVRQFAARRVPINAADYDGRSPLHLAASEGHAHVVKWLLRHGADALVTDRWGGTPLDDARRGNHDEVVAMIEQALSASSPR